MKACSFIFAVLCASGLLAATNDVVELGKVVVEAATLSRYRPETVSGGTFTDLPPEKLPCVVDTLTQDFIRERNPTDLNDLLRWVPGLETGGTSLLVRQPGFFTMRGAGASEPAIDGMFGIGRGAGLFMDPFMMERVEIVKGPTASLAGGSGASQNANGGGGAVNIHMKGAFLDRDEKVFQENTSVGKDTFRQRAMADVNETFADGKGAVRVVATGDYYEPAYIHTGLQKGARGREQFGVAPSLIYRANDDVTMGVKTFFQYADAPSYIGVPVWKGKPAGGYRWYESSCRRGDRQHYEGMMINPWLDWQVTEEWLLKFGGCFQMSSMDHSTLEPYSGSGSELENFLDTGTWSSGKKYSKTGFSESSWMYRNYNLYTRSVYTTDFESGIRNVLLVQPDIVYRDACGSAADTSRYGATFQDSVEWGWFTLLGGVRYDYFHKNAYTSSAGAYSKGLGTHAVSPRGGLTIQPIEGLVFFGNVSQTRTPMFDCCDYDGHPLLKPWYNTQYEGGIRLKTAEKLWLTVSAYRIEQEDALVEGGRTATGYWYTQDGRTTSRGAELSLSGDITKDWTMMAMYAYNRYTNRSVSKSEKGRDFERNPAHTFTLNTSYRFSSGWLEDVSVGGGFRFRSMSYACFRGQYKDKNLRFDPSYLLDLNCSMPLSKFGGLEEWILSFGIRNVLGEKYFDTTRHYYECLAGEPRTFELGLRASF